MAQHRRICAVRPSPEVIFPRLLAPLADVAERAVPDSWLRTSKAPGKGGVYHSRRGHRLPDRQAQCRSKTNHQADRYRDHTDSPANLHRRCLGSSDRVRPSRDRNQRPQVQNEHARGIVGSSCRERLTRTRKDSREINARLSRMIIKRAARNEKISPANATKPSATEDRTFGVDDGSFYGDDIRAIEDEKDPVSEGVAVRNGRIRSADERKPAARAKIERVDGGVPLSRRVAKVLTQWQWCVVSKI